MKELKFKNCDSKIEGVEEKKDTGVKEGIVEGYASVFGVIDFDDDVIDKGAFTETIDKTRGVWPVLGSHDARIRLGYNEKAKEDDYGLWFRERLNLEVQAAREQFSLTRMAHDMGGKDGISIGFNITSAEPDAERPSLRRIKKIEMWEHSHVTFGANQLALTDAAKGWLINDLAKDHHEYADRFYKHMEYLGFKFGEVQEALDAIHAKKTGSPSKTDKELLDMIDRAVDLISC